MQIAPLAAGVAAAAVTAPLMSAATRRSADSPAPRPWMLTTAAGLGVAALAVAGRGRLPGAGVVAAMAAGIAVGSAAGGVLGGAGVTRAPKQAAPAPSAPSMDPAPTPPAPTAPAPTAPATTAPATTPGSAPPPTAPAPPESTAPAPAPATTVPPPQPERPAPAPDPTPEEPAPPQQPAPVEASSPAAASRPILRVGSRGPEVAQLKERLAQLQYHVDGGDVFTEHTRDAVMAFQKVNGIGRDGAVGPQTRAAMENPRMPDIGTGPAERVVVDKSDQVLYMVHGGRLAYIVPVSTGNPHLADGRGSATPSGSFRIQRKIDGPRHAPLGTLYSPSYFKGGYAFHGSYSIPPTPQSHGCVRVPMWFEKQAFRELPIGFAVQIRE